MINMWNLSVIIVIKHIQYTFVVCIDENNLIVQIYVKNVHGKLLLIKTEKYLKSLKLKRKLAKKQNKVYKICLNHHMMICVKIEVLEKLKNGII